MAFGPYQHVGFAYQGVGGTAYQIGVVGSGTLSCGASDITGVGTVSGGGGPSPSRMHKFELYPEPITHRQ